MIKLVERKVKVDTDTFQPICRITIDVPLEGLVDLRVEKGKEQLYRIIGEELIEAIQNENSLKAVER